MCVCVCVCVCVYIYRIYIYIYIYTKVDIVATAATCLGACFLLHLLQERRERTWCEKTILFCEEISTLLCRSIMMQHLRVS